MNLINTDPFRELENHPTKRTETKLQNLLRSFKNNKYLSEKFINKYMKTWFILWNSKTSQIKRK